MILFYFFNINFHVNRSPSKYLENINCLIGIYLMNICIPNVKISNDKMAY